MKALVLGGAGFIGSHVADALLKRGYQVRALDNLESRAHPHGFPAYLDKNIRLLKGDIRDRAAMETALEGVDVVLHQAEYAGSGPDYAKFFHSNVVSTALLFEIIRERRLPVQKVVVASSLAVYGEGQYCCASHGLVLPQARPLGQLDRGDWENECPECHGPLVAVLLREGHTNPNSPYGISKLAQEQTALRLGALVRVPTVVLRYAVVQGPRQRIDGDSCGVCHTFLGAMENGESPMILEDGKQLRDYVHVSDVASANVLALEDARANGQTYNVGTGRGTSVLDYARVLMQRINREVPTKITGKYRAQDCRHAIPSIARLQTLGWKPSKGLNDILNDSLSERGMPAAAADRSVSAPGGFVESGTINR